MKRAWLAAAVLGGILALGVCHVEKLATLTGELNVLLEEAERRAEGGNWQGAVALTQGAARRWAGESFYLHITLEHQVCDEIDGGFSQVLEFLERREEGEYSAANAQLMTRLKLLGEMERPTVENLL